MTRYGKIRIGIDEEALATWARRILTWARGQEPEDSERVTERTGPHLPFRDVYVYFDNDKKVRAPFDAICLDEVVKASLCKEQSRYEELI